MSPIQQMLLGVGAVDTKTYVDDIFSTYLHTGTGSAKSINNGIDLAGEGGLVWGKSRSHAHTYILIDTVRGASNALFSQNANAQYSYSPALITSFNNNGYSVAADGSGSINYVESGGNELSAWTFRQAPGFFDIVTYTGNGSNRTIAHSLGSVPGAIWIKQLNGAGEWICYHRSVGAEKFLQLNNTEGENDDATVFQDTEPTASVFSLGTHAYVNGNNNTYVAYVFAGGEVTDTSRSVEFDGSGDSVSIPDSSDLDFGSGDYTVECWFRQTGAFQDWRSILAKFDGSGSIWIHTGSGGKIAGGYNQNVIAQQSGVFTLNTWNHVAISRSGTSWRLFLNGAQMGSTLTESGSNDNNHALLIGDIGGVSGREFEGQISNVRVVKGTALYTSSFKPQLKTVENITNTKLLCCNSSSVTGSTVTPGTITTNGNPTASTLSPGFDDPAGFAFGENEDQNVIKCGSYVGNGSSTGPEIDLGWEPQWVLIKHATSGNSSPWSLWDSMRGIVTGANDAQLYPNQTQTEYTGANRIDLTSTGFKIFSTSHMVNTNNSTYVYCCIRRPDGYVGKPPELGTGVFNMVAGTNSAPAFVSGFPVDFSLYRQPAAGHNWHALARLMGSGSEHTYLRTNGTNAEVGGGSYKFDFMNGWLDSTGWDSTYQAWMWKRHAGFDVVTYTGDGSLRTISHSMGIAPEMMWFKKRNDSKNWYVYHKGLDGGSSPEDYSLRLNTTAAQDQDGNTLWNETVPTATHFTINTDSGVNADGDDYIAMLFASVDGISKVGYYNGSDSAQTITTGFQPRFVIIKRSSDADEWFVLDTTRGYGSGNDQSLELDTNNAQSSVQAGAPTSTGFTVPALSGNDFAYGVNGNGYKFVYYAHA